MRSYNIDFSKVKLERKSMAAGLTDAERIINGDFSFLKESGDTLLMGFYLAYSTLLIAPR